LGRARSEMREYRYNTARVTSGVCFVLESCLAYFAMLKLEEIFSSETSVDFQGTTRHYIPEGTTLKGQM
jgi:hypothetical protein